MALLQFDHRPCDLAIRILQLDMQTLQHVGLDAVRMHHTEGETAGLRRRDEQQGKGTVLDQGLKYLLQQLLFAATPHNGAVGGTQHVVQVGQAPHLLVRLHAFDRFTDALRHRVEQGMLLGQENLAVKAQIVRIPDLNAADLPVANQDGQGETAGRIFGRRRTEAAPVAFNTDLGLLRVNKP